MSIEQNIGTYGSPQNKILEKQVQQNTVDIQELQDTGLQIEDGSVTDAKLSNDAGQTKAKITVIETEQTTQNTRLTNVESGEVAQDAAIAANAAAAAANAANINTNINEINALDGRMDLVEAEDVAQNLRLDTVEAKDATQDGRLDAVEAKDATQDGRLDTIESEQTTQNADILQNATDIANLTVGATELISAFVATNPLNSDLEITYADAFVDNGVYFIVNPKTLDGTGMTISKDAGVTKLFIKDELDNQVIGNTYNVNDSVFIRYRLATNDFVMLTPVSSAGFEQRLDNVEADVSDILDGTQKANKAINDTDGNAIDTTYKKVNDINVVEIQTGALPSTWTTDFNVFYADITLTGFTCTVNDDVSVNDLSLDEVDLALVQSAGIFYAERQTDSTVRLKATANIDLSTVDYKLVVIKDGAE